MTAETGRQEEVILDVRKIPLIERHDRIFESFDDLPGGSILVIINDHDPKPLWYQFSVERENQFTWEYLEQGPEAWRVAIRKT